MYKIFSTLPNYLTLSETKILLVIILTMTVFICVKLVISGILESIILLSAFSLSLVISYLLMDAPDVAMTEAALSSCLSTCVLLNVIQKFRDNNSIEKIAKIRFFLSSILSILLLIVLAYVMIELPLFGNSESNIQKNISNYYIKNTTKEIGISSFVAAILASYRGYDTLFETSVILLAGIAVTLIMSTNKVKNV